MPDAALDAALNLRETFPHMKAVKYIKRMGTNE
jgi:hypothetical protein